MARRVSKKRMKRMEQRGTKIHPTVMFLPDFPDQVKAIAMTGLSDDEMAVVFGISEDLMQNWKEFYPDFKKAIREGRTHADVAVLQALHTKAVGYEHVETRTYYNHEDDYVLEHDVMKHVSPDFQSIKLWLTNRRKEEWKDRNHSSHSGGGGDDSPIGIGVRDESKQELMSSILALIHPKPDNEVEPE